MFLKIVVGTLAVIGALCLISTVALFIFFEIDSRKDKDDVQHRFKD